MDRQLRRDFRRWNRSRSKYEKAVRAYQFKETKKNYQELAKNFLPKFGITIKELKATRGGQNILKDLNTWFEHAQTQDVQQIVQDPVVVDDPVPDEEDTGSLREDLGPVQPIETETETGTGLTAADLRRAREGL